MKRSFPVVDADGHVIERDRELREFLPAPYRGVAGKREYPLFSWDRSEEHTSELQSR